MALRIIRQEGDDILKKKSRPVEEIDDKIKELFQNSMEQLLFYIKNTTSFKKAFTKSIVKTQNTP